LKMTIGIRKINADLSPLSPAEAYRQRPRAPNPIASDVKTQQELLAECYRISGTPLD